MQTPLEKDLEYFLGCARVKNITKAADQLGVQQSGLSKSIQKLESAYGEKLFIRTRKGLELTPFGLALYEALLSTKNHWSEVFSSHTEKIFGGVGLLRIGCHTSVACHEFPKLFPTLQAAFPHLDLQPEFLPSLEVTRKVAALELDLGIVVNPVINPDLVTKSITSQFIGLWGSHLSAAASKRILFNPQMYLLSKIQKAFRDHQFLEMPDYEVMANMAKGGHYKALLPNTVADRYGLKLLAGPLQKVQLALIYHRQNFLSTPRRKVTQEVLRALKS